LRDFLSSLLNLLCMFKAPGADPFPGQMVWKSLERGFSFIWFSCAVFFVYLFGFLLFLIVIMFTFRCFCTSRETGNGKIVSKITCNVWSGSLNNTQVSSAVNVWILYTVDCHLRSYCISVLTDDTKTVTGFRLTWTLLKVSLVYYRIFVMKNDWQLYRLPFCGLVCFVWIKIEKRKSNWRQWYILQQCLQ